MSKEEMEYEKVIRSNYAEMADEDLVNLWNERYGLTSVAIEALQQEMNKRALVPGDNNVIANEEVNAITQEKYSKAEMKGFWQLIMNLKMEGQPDEVIVKSLLKKEMAPDDISHMLQNLSPVVIENINEADSDRLGALIRLCCGIAVIIITMLASLGNGMYFVGWMTIALSIVQTAIAASKKSRYQTILDQISHQQIQETEE